MSKLSTPIDYEELKKRTDEYEREWREKKKKTATKKKKPDCVKDDADIERLAYFLPDYVKTHLTPSKGDNKYNCPFCPSGTGKNETGAFGIVTENPRKYHCFACGAKGDLFDLIGQVEGIPEFVGRVARAKELYGGGEPAKVNNMAELRTAPQQRKESPDLIKSPAVNAAEMAELDKYFSECNTRLQGNTYRGISRETLDRFKVGYDPAWKNPAAENAPTSPRIIIPTGGGSYIARHADENEKDYRYFDVGEKRIFNSQALITATAPVFIVEGEIDAMSIIDAGGEAVGLGGISGINKLVALLSADKPKAPLIVALDNDKPNKDGTPGAGPKATAELIDALDGLKIPYFVMNVYGDAKDANEALQRDREALEKNIAGVLDAARREYVGKNSIAGYMDTFIEYLQKGQISYPTGLTKFDRFALGGGLHPGLIVIGALSGLGKTTFILQIADNMAKSGQDVMFFALEMGRNELIAKSLSRISFVQRLEKYGDSNYTKTTGEILQGAKYFNESEIGVLKDALTEYERGAEHMFIFEGNDLDTDKEVTVDTIADKVAEHVKQTGRHPVVFVDYLQILQPAKDKMTDTEAVRYNVKALKEISRVFDIPVITISAFNRSSYKGDQGQEAFKQSGGIEYSADVLLKLQYDGQGKESFKREDAENEYPRKIYLSFLKNRHGGTNKADMLQLYPDHNYFLEKEFDEKEGFVK